MVKLEDSDQEEVNNLSMSDVDSGDERPTSRRTGGGGGGKTILSYLK